MKLVYLTQEFYEENSGLKELLQKKDRPYAVYMVKINENEFAIPFRSSITHRYCYDTGHVKGRKGKTGLDYTKAVIISKKDYIGNLATINKQEFDKLRGKNRIISQQFNKFIEKYKEALKKINEGKGNNRMEQLIRNTTLQNYHKELGI